LDQEAADDEVVKIVGVERVAVVEVRRARDQARMVRELPLCL
jgi:hypothetical protein